MTKFNAPSRNILQERRSKKAQRKRLALADPKTLKRKLDKPPASISGKRKRKLFKKWRREQRAAIENGLVTMEDIQMMSVDNEGDNLHEKTQDSSTKGLMHLHMKKRAKLKLRKGKGKNRGKGNKSGPHDSANNGDAMVE